MLWEGIEQLGTIESHAVKPYVTNPTRCCGLNKWDPTVSTMSTVVDGFYAKVRRSSLKDLPHIYYYVSFPPSLKGKPIQALQLVPVVQT